MEKKFTPGPWWVQGNDDFGYFVQAKRLKPEHGYDIEILGDDHNAELYPEEVYQADCHIVAAAPELLEELEKHCARCFSSKLCNIPEDCGECSTRKAIKKAYGEPG